MTTPAIVVSSTLAQERMDRLRGLFGQIEREFGDLIEENAERASLFPDLRRAHLSSPQAAH